MLAFAAGLIAWYVGWPHQSTAAGQEISIEHSSFAIHGDNMDVSATVVSKSTVRLQGWYFLAAPDDAEPWTNFEYQSAIIQQSVTPHKPVTFHWSERITARDGAYQPTLWFHKYLNGGWVHANGGAFGLKPVTLVRGDLRYDQRFGGAAATVAIQGLGLSGDKLTFEADLQPSKGVSGLTFYWELRPSGSWAVPATFTSRTRQLATDPSSGTIRVSVSDELALPPGGYDLWLHASSTTTETVPQEALYSDAVPVLPPLGYTRSQEPTGPYAWTSVPARTTLTPDASNTLDVSVDGSAPRSKCVLFWHLGALTGDAVVNGTSSRCDSPTITLPVLDPGRYSLGLFAVDEAADGSGSSLSDAIELAVSIAP
jgi:hypothetical protein